MDCSSLLRLSFILQDNSFTTTKNYLAKIIEDILCNSPADMEIPDIVDAILTTYNLEFSEKEVLDAIQKRTQNIIQRNGGYSISPSYVDKIKKAIPFEVSLKEYIQRAITDLKLSIGIEEYYDLIIKYLYYCFNSNKKVLINLIKGKNIEQLNVLSLSDKDMWFINQFINWDNQEKNVFIYKIVSICYVYCTLNTKKDALFSKSIFKNKQFYLDANIIFRLAGINNDDRQRTISSFIKKCKEVGIVLSYTDKTFDEIYRVINSKVLWLKKITQSSEPIDLSEIEAYQNDFYNLYVKWSRNPQNKYDDFASFQNYLIDKISYVISELRYSESANYEVIETKNFQAYCNSLEEYKKSNARNGISSSSIKTDINNILYLLPDRRASQSTDIFSTNKFFISADQVLISWYQKNFSGVPLIVLPSVWLTILLRFTGRTDDDYKAFCAFMNLRIPGMVDDFDIFSIIKELSLHTSDKELKRKIILEVINNKEEYIDDIEAEKTVNKAFEKIKSQEVAEITDSYKAEIKNREELYEKEKEEARTLSKKLGQDELIEKIVNKHCNSQERKWFFLKRNKQKISLVITLLLIVLVLLWLFDIYPFCLYIENLFPTKVSNNMSLKLTCLGGACGIYVFLTTVFSNLIDDMCSEGKIINNRKKYKDKVKRMLDVDKYN